MIRYREEHKDWKEKKWTIPDPENLKILAPSVNTKIVNQFEQRRVPHKRKGFPTAKPLIAPTKLGFKLCESPPKPIEPKKPKIVSEETLVVVDDDGQEIDEDDEDVIEAEIDLPVVHHKRTTIIKKCQLSRITPECKDKPESPKIVKKRRVCLFK